MNNGKQGVVGEGGEEEEICTKSAGGGSRYGTFVEGRELDRL